MTTSDEPAVLERPEIAFRYCRLDVEMPSGGQLISDIHDLLYLNQAADMVTGVIHAMIAYLDNAQLTPPGDISPSDIATLDTAETSILVFDVSRVLIYQRDDVTGETRLPDWTIPGPDPSLHAIWGEITVNTPVLGVVAVLENVYSELNDLNDARALYGDRIDEALRIAANIPDEIDRYTARSTTGETGWICESVLERTESIDYRTYTLMGSDAGSFAGSDAGSI